MGGAWSEVLVYKGKIIMVSILLGSSYAQRGKGDKRCESIWR